MLQEKMERLQTSAIEMAKEQEQNSDTVRTPDKAAYMERISALSAEDQAFLDGYLFAKVTQKGA